ncbi:glycosyl hydrolase family 38 protein [Parabacteroides sp. CAG:409]|nr:glycosyl hydrolase family 38 protein [Parabacteroides sp. CAG:409]
MRHWTVYLYNHAHVDIGYTNTHRNVEALHKNNVLEGMKLGNETKDHVDGARFVWNPEVSWPVERLWHDQPEVRDELVSALKDGRIALDASYLNLNTSICLDEELFHVFKFSREMQRLSGQPMDVFQQFDIPGITWGLIPVMAQEGVKYIISWPNSDRAGNAHLDLDGKPFWWVGPDGESKVLFLQPGQYANSGSMTKGGETGRPWFGQRDQKKVPLRIQTGKANVDFTDKLIALEKDNYPYDFTVLSWSLWDNNPLDADVPYAVQAWNTKYAYPKIRICGGHEIMSMIEEKYGKDLPVVKGDYTEYWTDGLGTAARLTAMNRNAKERVSQAETLWSMLADGNAAPREEFDEAWKYILLGSEHTWCFENPAEPFFQDAIWKVKQSYFHEAEDRSIQVLDEALAPATDKSNGGLGPKEGPSNGGIAVFNTHTWKQGGVVTLSPAESMKGDQVVDDQGNTVPSQRLSTGELLFLADEVPALGSAHYHVVEGTSPAQGTCKIQGTTLENEFLQVKIDEKTGNIVSLQRKGDTYNYIDPSVDGGANSFAWLPANKDLPQADTVQAISVVENGPLVVELRIDSKAKGCRSVSRSVRLVAGLPWVEISNVVDKLPWLEKDGIHFGFGFHVPQSTTRVDIPWGVMEVEKDQWKQGNRNWLTLQRWLDVSNETHGVTWCSLDAPLFEYGNRLANIALGWGGKGPWAKTLPPSSTIYSWVMNNHWHTNFPTTQEGPVTFRYRLYPHLNFDIVESNRFGLEQSQPLVHVTADKDPKLTPLLSVDNEQVYATILKSTGQDQELIVRLRSLSDKEESVSLSYPGKEPSRVSLCRLEEIPGEEIRGAFSMKPYGQVTLKIEFKE